MKNAKIKVLKREERNLLAAFARYLTSIVHVAFVCADHSFDVGRGVLFDVADPVLDVVEGFLIGYVVDEQNSLSAHARGLEKGNVALKSFTMAPR